MSFKLFAAAAGATAETVDIVAGETLSASDVVYLSVGAGLPWTPAAITTTLWLDAADVSTITESGGALSQWDDKSGNSNNATQGTGSNQPTYGTDIVTFDGTNEFVNVAHGVVPDLTDASMIVFVGQVDATTGYNQGFFSNGRAGFAGQGFGWRTGTTSPGTSMLFAGYYDDLSVTLSTAVTTKSIQGLARSLTGVTLKVYQDGTLEGTKTSFLGNANVGSELGVFGKAISTEYLKGGINEIVIIDGEPVSATRELVEGYLAWKWGLQGSLPALHPYKSAAPTTGATTAGRAYLTDTDAAMSSTTGAVMGIVTSLASDGTAGTVVTAQLTGTVAGLSLSSGKFYGLSATAGALALTAALPTIGYASSTTELQLTGEITGLSSLTAGTAYKSDGSGDLAVATSDALGYATSTTSLLIRGQFGSTEPA